MSRARATSGDRPRTTPREGDGAASRERSSEGAAARRRILQGALAALLFPVIEGCGAASQPPATTQPPLPPLATSPLATLVAAAGVRWMLVAAPKDLFGVPWVPPLIDVAVSGARFERFAKTTGIDLRTLPEAVVAACAPSSAGGAAPSAGGAPSSAGAAPSAIEDEDVMFYLARHTGDAQAIERSYRARFTSAEKRSVERPDLIRMSGKVGQRQGAAVFLGRDVAGFQDGGSASRGPARVAALFAEGKLKHARSALAAEPLRSLALRLGPGPLAAYAPGPFDGELGRGLRGLLGAATAIGAVLGTTERQSFLVRAAVTGDFSTSAAPASDELLAAWKDLAGSRLGHMLGLDKPLSAPVTQGAPDVVMLAVELSGRALSEGLAAATASRVEDIFRENTERVETRSMF